MIFDLKLEKILLKQIIMQNNTIISLKNIHKSFYLDDGTEIPVLKWIDLEIKSWEFITLM